MHRFWVGEKAQEYGRDADDTLNWKFFKRLEILIICFLNPISNTDFNTDCVKQSNLKMT